MDKDNPQKVQDAVCFMVLGTRHLMYYKGDRIVVSTDGSGVIFIDDDDDRSIKSCVGIDQKTWDVVLGPYDTCLDLRKK